MLPEVHLGRHCCAPSTHPDNYRPLVGDALIDEIQILAKELAGVRVCQINATAAGGGVAELLGRQIPSLRALGVDVEWRLIHGTPDFFALTKSFHNALQSAELDLTEAVKQTYRKRNRDCAAMLDASYDVYIVHDPQPAALRYFARDRNARWIWRCHIDSSTPNPDVWHFLAPFGAEYDAAVFTLAEFCPPDLRGPRLVFMPPAIDPLGTKNMALPGDLPRQVLADAGVDLRRPLLLQVSRFDPWKDPLGVIQTYRLVKAQRPEVQLALVGAMAGDDPEGWAILETINTEAAHDTDIYVFTNLTGIGNMEVNAFQRGADVILQKSLKEGFGLVVSEALWKAKPMVAGRAGGIPMQFPDAYQDFLVDNVEDCAARVLSLLEDAPKRAAFGQAGQTPGFSGADLANVINEAALLAARAGKAAVEMSDLREAIDRMVAGLEKKSRVINPQEKEVVAFHEAGHALVAASLPGTDPVRKISIVPRGIAALGYTQQQPTEDRYLLRKSELYNRLCVLLGGRVAEELVFGDVSTGAHDDLRKVSDMARAMVTTYGMSDAVGLLTYEQPPSLFLPGVVPTAPKTYSEDTARQIDTEVRAIVDRAHEQVRQLLDEKKTALQELARHLLEKEVLEGDELQTLLTPQPATSVAFSAQKPQGAI